MQFSSDCFGLNFEAGEQNGDTLKFKGQSSVGTALMVIDFSTSNPKVKITGRKLNNSSGVLKPRQDMIYLDVKLLHDEGLCTFNFPVFGLNTKQDKRDQYNIIPEPAAHQNVDEKMNDINKAKEICSDLGFKEKTERFGDCVLQLIK